MTDTATLERVLDDLQLDPPASLERRILATWVRVDGRAGPVYVATTDRGVAMVVPASVVDDDGARFAAAYSERFERPIVAGDRVPRRIERALETGDGRGVDYDLRGLSAFEEDVLRKTLEIPVGEVRPYAWVAREIGRPRAVRATGSALGRNPVPVLIPCHRVTRSDGLPGNYAYGPALKERLLAAEDVDVDDLRDRAARGALYVGSATNDVVCYPTCRHARRIAARHRREFRSLTAAASAGYRPCRDCRPAAA